MILTAPGLEGLRAPGGPWSPSSHISDVSVQGCLEEVVRVGCMGQHLDGSHVHAEAAEQQRALFFDLKLVLGPDLSCLCHKCVSLP